MRARLPDREGVIQCDGVRVAFEVVGHGEPALLLIPASPITHARSWKGIVPALARRFTIVTTDGRGTGRSDRPRTPERYTPAEVTADLLAVLDAASVDQAVLVAHCHAVPWALRLAAPLACPVLVMHGTQDAVRSYAEGEALADCTGGALVSLAGAGHFPQARDPVRVNLLIKQFADRFGR